MLYFPPRRYLFAVAPESFKRGGYMKKNSGFTLTEVVIVIIIVGILSIISVPIYRDHVSKSIAVEGQALLSEVIAAQEIHLARTKVWFNPDSYTTTPISYAPAIGVDARRNKYFNSFTWRALNDGGDDQNVSFSITTNGILGTKAEGISLTLNYFKGKPYEIIQN